MRFKTTYHQPLSIDDNAERIREQSFDPHALPGSRRGDGTEPKRGKLIAELPRDRYAIESDDAVHRIFDFGQASSEEQDPHGIAGALHELAAHDAAREQAATDRRIVADQRVGMPARLAAMARLNRQRGR